MPHDDTAVFVSATTVSAGFPPGAAGQWCRIGLTLPPGPVWWARLELTDEARGQVVRDCFLGPARATPGGETRATLVHVPAAARGVAVHIVGRDALGAALHVERLGRAEAAATLLWQGRRLVAASLAGDQRGRLGRLRAILGQAPARAGEAPPYAVWIDSCESDLPPPPVTSGMAPLAVIAGVDGPAVQATCASLAAQTMRSQAPRRVFDEADWRDVAAPWVVLVQGGEVLAPTAMAWFAYAIAANPHAALITADCDLLKADGSRADPLFKPGPDPILLRSFLPIQGACAIRWPQPPPVLPVSAQQARRVLALLHPDSVVHVPRVLTHIGDEAAPLPPEPRAVARRADFVPSVTALVPSALRRPHVLRCLDRIVNATDYPRFSVHLIVSDATGASQKLLGKVRSLRDLRVLNIDLPDFNYAVANNKAAAEASGDLLLLLNDDVAPLRPDWLSAMVAHMQDPRVGIVGARLLYGNGMVQHEGVIMGLANLCEHAGRLRPGDDAGPHGLGLMDRQVSAVTGACLLIRASLYRDLGGMDERFAIALNDVDLCLRARQTGWRVVYCAQAEMSHYESLSLGRHYAGRRAVLESQEVSRLRGRWQHVIAADPFYSPLASLEPGREWQPGFPPRVAEIVRGEANPAATGS